jgi:hypothetical protein
MSEHPKANALAENVYVRLTARISMLVAAPLIALALNWISDISTAQNVQSTFQATQQIEMAQLKERVGKLEDAGKDDAQVLQRLATVEALMRNLAEQSTATRQSIDNLTQQLIRERRSDASEFPNLK